MVERRRGPNLLRNLSKGTHKESAWTDLAGLLRCASAGAWVQDAEAFDVWVGADSTATLNAGFTLVR